MLKITTLAVLVALIAANSAAAFGADPPSILNLTFIPATSPIVDGAPAGTPIGTLSATTVGSATQANLSAYGNQDKCVLSGSKSPATVSLPVVAIKGNHACTFSAALGGAVGTPYFQTVVFNVAAKKPPPLPDPTLQISANPLQVIKGGPVTVTWNGANIVTGATPCTASGIWAGSKAASGTESVTPAVSGVATLSCPGLSGKTATQSSSNVTVGDPPPPVADTTPTNATVGTGEDALVLSIGQDYYLGPATYTVKVDGVQMGGNLTAHALHSNPIKDIVTINGSWVGGSHNVQVQMLEDAWGGSADKDRNLYVESAKYNGASVSGASLYLNTAAPQTFTFVDLAPPPIPDPTLTLSANPLTVITGGKSTLSWSAQNAASCTASGGWTGSRPLTGTESVGPTVDTNYAMDCVAATGKHAAASVMVRIGQAPPAGAMGPLHTSPGISFFVKPDGTPVYVTGSHTWNDLQNEGSTFPPASLDYTGYLNWMQANDFNFFRMWIVGEQPSGAAWTSSPWYTEPNPFSRTGPGTAADGKLKFDLTKYNPEYFDRMRARVIEAQQHGIYVSVMLFNGWGLDNYSKGGGNPWSSHPYNRNNNINGIDGDPSNTGNGDAIQTPSASSAVWQTEQAYIRKVIDTVGDLPNVLYEVSNESLPTDSNTQWQYNVINYVHSYESGRPQQHPVGMTAQFPQGQLAPMLNSPAEWISPSPAGDYRDNPPPNNGPKIIFGDTDHLWGDGGDILWVWKSFTRGVNPIYMDGLGGTGINLGGRTAVSNPLYYTTRKGMTQTAAYAARMDLRIAKPDTTTSSTGYALAGPGQYLAFAPTGGNFTVNLSQEYGGNLSLEWFDINSGNKSTNSVVGWNTAQAFQSPFNGPTALFLKRTSPPVPQPPAGDYLMVQNMSGADLSDYSLQFGRPFVCGEIAHYPQPLFNGTAPIAWQSEVKNRCADGSAKYAVISMMTGKLPLGTRNFVTFKDSLTGNTAPIAMADLLTQFPDFDATIQLTGASGSVSAFKMLQDGNCKPWTSGPVEVVLQCRDLSTARVYDLDPTGHGWKPFHPEFELSFWPQTKQVQVRYIGEVSNSMGLEAFTADVKLTAGKANPTVVYQQAGIQHSIRTRWTRTAWIGGTPEPKINIDHNIAHLSKTGYLWNFDPSVKIPESVRADAYAKWQGSDHDRILSTGLWMKTMGDVGYHPEIGPMPVWYNRTLFSGGDYRMREVMLGQADLASAFPMQMREGDPARFTSRAKTTSALGLPVTQYVRPYYQGADKITVHSPRCSDWVDDQYCNGGWYPDTAHMPDPWTLPYITTADPFYLEGAQLWGAFETFGPEGLYVYLRQGGQTRAQAWVLRGIVEAWGLSPDADPMRVAFHDALDDTFAAWEGERGITGTKFQGTPNWTMLFNRIGKPDANGVEGDVWLGLGVPPLHFWSFRASNPQDCGQWYFGPACERDITPWQVGFLGVAMSAAVEHGYTDALPTLRWFAENITGQALDPNYGAGYMGAFIAPATKHGANGSPAHFTSWSDVKTAWSDQFKNMVASYNAGVWLYWWATGGEIYWDVARGGIGTIADKVPNGIAAWQKFNDYNDQLVVHNNHGVSWDNDPTWDILPRQ